MFGFWTFENINVNRYCHALEPNIQNLNNLKTKLLNILNSDDVWFSEFGFRGPTVFKISPPSYKIVFCASQFLKNLGNWILKWISLFLIQVFNKPRIRSTPGQGLWRLRRWHERWGDRRHAPELAQGKDGRAGTSARVSHRRSRSALWHDSLSGVYSEDLNTKIVKCWPLTELFFLIFLNITHIFIITC